MVDPNPQLPDRISHAFTGAAVVTVEKTRLRLPARHRSALREGQILKAGRLDVLTALHLRKDETLADPLCVALFPILAFEATVTALSALDEEMRGTGARVFDYLVDEFEDCPIQQNFRVELSSFLVAAGQPERADVAVVGRGAHLLVVSTQAADLLGTRCQRERAGATDLILRVQSGVSWEPDDER